MKQPRALISLSLSELWERFGLYIVQGLLIFYMTKVLTFSDGQSYLIMGQFTALVYISPIIGGLCADRLLGFRQTILIGAVLLLAGYALLAFPIANKENALFLGLAIIILGTGCLKPNISSFLGQFYQADDPRRDAGFTIYYMIFNFGIMLATLSSGYIERNFGWHACFAAASCGLVLSICFFRAGYRHYGNQGLPLRSTTIKQRAAFAAIIVIGTAACYAFLKISNFGNTVLVTFGLIMLLLLITNTFKLEKLEQYKMLSLLILIVISIAFWAIFFQIFLVANVFIDRNVDRVVFGHTIPPMAFISLEPLFLFILSPLLAFGWRKLHEKNWNISRSLQFTIGLIVIAVALQVLVWAIHLSTNYGLISPYWIVLSYLLITIAELMLSPIGLSMVTQLAPPKLVGIMMGVWFLGLGYGGLLAGYLGKQASIPKDMINNIAYTNPIYAHAFQNYAWLGFGAAGLTLILSPFLNKLINRKKSCSIKSDCYQN
ncbi:MAG: peptide MFS transporter [Proteobacteria bacterium]|nr:peptide MFS transporter [Pseudomonadota bacterium]